MNFANNVSPATKAAAVIPVTKKGRMTLASVRRGKAERPVRVLVYGPEKVGKSTFASGAPSPLWLGKDAGTEHLDIARLPQPESWGDVLDALVEVERNGLAGGFATLVVDPVTWFEPLVQLAVTGDPEVGLVDWKGGFGKGPDAAATQWRRFLVGLERVWEAGLNVVLIAHSEVKKFKDPEGEDYERYELAMLPKVAGMLKQWADAILFAKRDAYGHARERGARVKAYGTSAVLLHSEWSPAYDAGNRYCLPQTLPMSWRAFDEARLAGATRERELRAQIEAALTELGDPEIEARVRGYLADASISLVEVANAVADKLGTKRENSGAAAERTEA